MLKLDVRSFGNRLIDALPASERKSIVPSIETATLVSGEIAHGPNISCDWVLFPIDAVLSVVGSVANGDGCEIGTIGNEGASGVDLAFGEPVLRTTVCQIAGSIGKLRRTAFLDAVDTKPTFAALVRKSEKARIFFIEQLVVCNTIHVVEQRCARWMLTMADRTTCEHYALTHEYLSLMLGVRRPAVTLAKLRLRKAGAITYRRGIVRIINRSLLESLACECYKATLDVFDAVSRRHVESRTVA